MVLEFGHKVVYFLIMKELIFLIQALPNKEMYYLQFIICKHLSFFIITIIFIFYFISFIDLLIDFVICRHHTILSDNSINLFWPRQYFTKEYRQNESNGSFHLLPPYSYPTSTTFAEAFTSTFARFIRVSSNSSNNSNSDSKSNKKNDNDDNNDEDDDNIENHNDLEDNNDLNRNTNINSTNNNNINNNYVEDDNVGVKSKEGTWWIGCRGNSYVGVYCNRPTVEVASPRHAAQVQV